MQSDFGLNKLDKKQKVSSQSSKNRPFCQTLELCLKTGQRRWIGNHVHMFTFIYWSISGHNFFVHLQSMKIQILQLDFA